MRTPYLFENPRYDEAIIGVTSDGNAVYDYELMVSELQQKCGGEYEEAAEFIDFNTIRAIPYAPDPKPIVMFRVE